MSGAVRRDASSKSRQFSTVSLNPPRAQHDSRTGSSECIYLYVSSCRLGVHLAVSLPSPPLPPSPLLSPSLSPSPLPPPPFPSPPLSLPFPSFPSFPPSLLSFCQKCGNVPFISDNTIFSIIFLQGVVTCNHSVRSPVVGCLPQPNSRASRVKMRETTRPSTWSHREEEGGRVTIKRKRRKQRRRKKVKLRYNAYIWVVGGHVIDRLCMAGNKHLPST